MAYMQNSVLVYDSMTSDNYIHADYTSRDFTKLHSIITKWDQSIFEWYKVNDNDKMERISHQLYGTTDYWDILVLINDLDALFGMPYAYDILDASSVETVNKYITAKTRVIMPDAHVQYMHDEYEAMNNTENEKHRIIKIVKPSKLQDFLRKGRDAGLFK